MTILKMADSPVLREKPVISPRNVSASEWTVPRIYKKNRSHDTKQPFWKDIGARNGPERSFHLLFVSSYSSAIFSFSTNYFSTPRERSEEHTSELQSHSDLVCRLLL